MWLYAQLCNRQRYYSANLVEAQNGHESLIYDCSRRVNCEPEPLTLNKSLASRMSDPMPPVKGLQKIQISLFAFAHAQKHGKKLL